MTNAKLRLVLWHPSQSKCRHGQTDRCKHQRSWNDCLKARAMHSNGELRAYVCQDCFAVKTVQGDVP